MAQLSTSSRAASFPENTGTSDPEREANTDENEAVSTSCEHQRRSSQADFSSS